jgi:hypothetical protein
VRLPDGEWGATLRIGLSMPQVTRLDAMEDAALHRWLADAMERIGAAIAPSLAAVPLR